MASSEFGPSHGQSKASSERGVVRRVGCGHLRTAAGCFCRAICLSESHRVYLGLISAKRCTHEARRSKDEQPFVAKPSLARLSFLFLSTTFDTCGVCSHPRGKNLNPSLFDSHNLRIPSTFIFFCGLSQPMKTTDKL